MESLNVVSLEKLAQTKTLFFEHKNCRKLQIAGRPFQVFFMALCYIFQTVLIHSTCTRLGGNDNSAKMASFNIYIAIMHALTLCHFQVAISQSTVDPRLVLTF